jgi:medium-chain acyl-[acyl-carrier-protein] hydrolase
MGALVAFELTRALRAFGAPLPARLIVSGRGAPHIYGSTGIIDLPDDDFIAELWRRYNGIPAALLDEPELLALFVPLLRADLALLERYHHEPGEPLPCPITAVGGDRDPNVSAADLDGWSRHTSGAFRREILAGEHFFIQSNQARMLALVGEELSRVT